MRINASQNSKKCCLSLCILALSNPHNNQALIAEAGAIPLIVLCMHKHELTPEIEYYGLNALANLIVKNVH